MFHHWSWLSYSFIFHIKGTRLADLEALFYYNWNYMPPILVPSSAKHIAIQVLVIAKWKKRFFFWEVFCLWFHPSLQRITCPKSATEIQEKNKVWNCSRIRMKILERCQWHRSSVFIVNCERICNFLLIIDFEQAKVCLVHVEKRNTFENKIRCIIR